MHSSSRLPLYFTGVYHYPPSLVQKVLAQGHTYTSSPETPLASAYSHHDIPIDNLLSLKEENALYLLSFLPSRRGRRIVYYCTFVAVGICQSQIVRFVLFRFVSLFSLSSF